MFSRIVSRFAVRQSLLHSLPLPRPTVRAFRSSQIARSSSSLVQHRDTGGNTSKDRWEVSAENKAKIEGILKRYPANYKASAVMPLLQMAQEQNQNWLPLAAMNKVAEICDMPPIRVYEVATFYSMFNRTPVGKYHIQLCGTTPCQLCGAEKILETIEKHLGIKAGETTKDGLFTVTEVECLGACANAPMIQINNHEFYENLTPETTVRLLEDLTAGRDVKVGPQNGQKNCEGPQGPSTLKDFEPQPQSRDIEALTAEIAKAQAKAAAEKAAGGPPKP